jgi:hypothetical protein
MKVLEKEDYHKLYGIEAFYVSEMEDYFKTYQPVRSSNLHIIRAPFI